ncbi:MAG: aminopeptidase P N-terminal domain-containing protein, partial [Salinisphaera sp.]|nr:aminopeptidase P N-terminal domain-containing protein [Salinisphaera sp.]
MQIDGKEYAGRRDRLAAAIGDEAVALVVAPPERLRNRDVHYPYRADSDLRYLTGFTEPDAVAVLAPGREDGAFLLFCRARDPQREAWEGLRAGPEGACRHFGADQAFPIKELGEKLPELLAGRRAVYHSLGVEPAADNFLIRALNHLRARARRGGNPPQQVVLLESVLHEMRLRKSAAELGAMRHAADVSAGAHVRAMRCCHPGMTEYALAAELHHEFEAAGMGWAYPSIVGGGANACVLHYIENADTLAHGDLVLVDAGAEYAGYAADITRSFPVNGRFSGPQRALYEVVLAAQHEAVDAVRAGNDYEAFHRAAVGVISRGLLDLGLLSGDVDEVIEQETYKPFFMHGTGHWLGMDV